ncbi:hypothetical protein AHiyo4_20060 [Arthrobacter sp. Hiyo4]|nr:hypothetical protein AHiyo4_20060 [Arthrobacter sp. Hiyo4]
MNTQPRVRCATWDYYRNPSSIMDPASAAPPSPGGGCADRDRRPAGPPKTSLPAGSTQDPGQMMPGRRRRRRWHGPGSDELADHGFPGARPGRVQHNGIEIPRLLAEDPFHPAVFDLHLRSTVKVLAGVPAGSWRTFYRENGPGLPHRVGQGRREQPGPGVEVGHHGTRRQESAIVEEFCDGPTSVPGASRWICQKPAPVTL